MTEFGLGLESPPPRDPVRSALAKDGYLVPLQCYNSRDWARAVSSRWAETRSGRRIATFAGWIGLPWRAGGKGEADLGCDREGPNATYSVNVPEIFGCGGNVRLSSQWDLFE